MVGLAQPFDFSTQFARLIYMGCTDELMEHDGLAADTLLTFIYGRRGRLLNANEVVCCFMDGQPVVDIPRDTSVETIPSRLGKDVHELFLFYRAKVGHETGRFISS